MPNLLCLVVCGLAGAFLLVLLGLSLAVPIGSLMYGPPPPRDPIGAILLLVGGFCGAFAGFFAGVVLALHRIDCGGD